MPAGNRWSIDGSWELAATVTPATETSIQISGLGSYDYSPLRVFLLLGTVELGQYRGEHATGDDAEREILQERQSEGRNEHQGATPYLRSRANSSFSAIDQQTTISTPASAASGM